MDSLTREGGFVFVDYRSGPAAGRYDKALALDLVLFLNGLPQTARREAGLKTKMLLF